MILSLRHWKNNHTFDQKRQNIEESLMCDTGHKEGKQCWLLNEDQVGRIVSGKCGDLL